VELFVDDVRARFASEKLAQLEERIHGEVDWDPEDLQAGFVLTVCLIKLVLRQERIALRLPSQNFIDTLRYLTRYPFYWLEFHAPPL
jgi:hypothetical protein